MISKKSKIIAALSLSMMIGIGSNVFAATNSTSKETKKTNKMIEMFKDKKGAGCFSIEALGLSKEDISAAKQSGKTIFDLAKEKKGMTADQVKAALIKAETDKINKKVSDGKLTQEKATAMIAKVTEKINNWDGSIKYFNHNDKDKKGAGFFAIEALGLSKEDIAAAKQSGKTIFDLAKEKKGMTADQVKAALIKAETDKINKKVSDGKLTQEKAAAMIAKITESINNWDGSIKYFNHNDKDKKGAGFFAIEALGLSKEDIATAKQSGKTIFDLAKEKKGMTADQVKAALIKAETDKINKKVSDGKLIQEKATTMIAKITERINNWDGSLSPAKPEKKEHTKTNSKENSKTKVNSKTTLKAQAQKKAI
ncbi:hypothetical protein [Clostridium lundense]|uniref:hypothetical protein n=1 Tax=Clostridium lundense TaxID=319475 RepID=UPI0004858874|nr:hypothetical protein [Clostridium lundense]